MSIPTTIRNRKQARLGCRKACSRTVECHLQHTPRGPHKHSSIQPVHETRLQVCIQTRRIDCILWRSTTRHTSCSHGQKTPRVIIIIDWFWLVCCCCCWIVRVVCFCVFVLFVCVTRQQNKLQTNKNNYHVRQKGGVEPLQPYVAYGYLPCILHTNTCWSPHPGPPGVILTWWWWWQWQSTNKNNNNIQQRTTRKGSDWNSQGCSFVTR